MCANSKGVDGTAFGGMEWLQVIRMKLKKNIYVEAVAACVIAAVCVVPLIMRGMEVNAWILYETGQPRIGLLQVLRHDSLIIFCAYFLLFHSFVISWSRGLAVIARVVSNCIILIYIADLAVFMFFNHRLVVTDAIRYWKFSFDFIEQNFELSFIAVLVAAFCALLYLYFFIFSKFTISHKSIRYVSTLLSLVMIAPIFLPERSYTHSWVVKNFVEYNISSLSQSKKYSPEFINAVNMADQKICTQTPGKKLNMIILMVESLSAYQSAFFSEIYDWTPNVDAIAARNVSYTNFYANGFATEDGVIALLTGQLPIDPPAASLMEQSVESFRGFYGVEGSLPKILGRLGYETECLMASDLAFSNEGVWAKSIGFDYVEGEENPFYDKWSEGVFKSAPDEALFARVLQRIEENGDHPFFFFVSTLSSHQPFRNPVTKERTEKASISYVDEQIGIFYENLIRTHFFDNGVLVIVGDHHSMVPLRREEVVKYGRYRAAAKVPLIVSFGGKLQDVVIQQHQQADIFNGLAGMATGNHCYSDWIGDVFYNGQRSPRFIVHKSGTDRNILNVFTEKKEYWVLMDGDDTQIVNDDAHDEVVNRVIIDKVNNIRIDKQREMDAGTY